MSATKPGSWGLVPEIAADTQGLVVSPFDHLPEAQALLLTLPARRRRGWLRALNAAVPVTPATGKADPSVAIAFTWSGLRAMGLDKAALASFPREFREGMRQHDRQWRLGDNADGAVVPGGPAWSANIPDPLAAPGQDVPPTPETVHALLLLYAADAGALDKMTAAATAVLDKSGVRTARALRLALRPDGGQIAREHFGFADGISQPLPYGDAVIERAAGRPFPVDPFHGVHAGDILIGQPNAHNEDAPGPLVADGSSAAMLSAKGAPPGFRNLGRNGSFLVVRELRQDVAGFWHAMKAEAANLADPALDAAWLAQKIVGRTQDGAPLVPDPPAGDAAKGFNDFLYFAADAKGLACPVGAHVRRANPRDGLGISATQAADLLPSVNSHRILRRGRKFGPPIADPYADDGQDRGLLFMCLNTDIARQFEFVQQTWLMNPGFGTLDQEVDPLVGAAGPMTIPAEPFRHRPSVPTFVRLAGGDYFFLPSLSALAYLEAL